MSPRSLLIAVFLFAAGFSAAGPHAAAQMPYRIGLQAGVTAERSSFRWIGVPGEALASEDRQKGFFGFLVEFPLAAAWRMEFSPHFGQRNFLPSSLGEGTGSKHAFSRKEVDFLALPLIVRYLFSTHSLVRPFLAAGLDFGLNLNHPGVKLTQVRYLEEPPLSMSTERIVYLNQLYGASLLEAGVDIQAADAWSVLLGVRYTHEWTPLLDDPSLTWETPHNWKVRFALLYTIDF
ncbi:MAG: hypothetical protein JXA28_01440 [Bacteroidetes bacterium]|nr:hypothetical protein [Bacteroidota bacterium]